MRPVQGSGQSDRRQTVTEHPAPLPAHQFLRWAWRQLTSMRNAIVLLLLLALASIPGSLLPQSSVNPQAVASFKSAHPNASPLLEAIGGFAVFSSVWFSAIYVLLMISLVGCIIPRTTRHLRAFRSPPPKVPANLGRLPDHRTFDTTMSADDVIKSAASHLRRRRYKVRILNGEISAEAGHLREFGNLVFHTCLLVVIIGVSITFLFGYRGAVVITEKTGFSNTLAAYDEFTAGNLYNRSNLPPFTMTLDDMEAEFQLTGPQRGAPRKFEAVGSFTGPDGTTKPFDITVNHPLKVEATNVFLVGQGYSPVVRVRDGRGKVAFEGAVPFLPRDSTYLSEGVIKAPDALPKQLGFQGFLLPTAVSSGGGPPRSAFPAAANPVLGLVAYSGDLGMDRGTPQSVYVLNKSNMRQINMVDNPGSRFTLALGQTVDLPGSEGSIEFVGLRQFARFQISSSPGAAIPLIGASVGIIGLCLSLAIRPRRIWVKSQPRHGGSLVEIGALSKLERVDMPPDLDVLVASLSGPAPDPS